MLLKFFFLDLYILHVWIFYRESSVHQVCTWCPWRSEESLDTVKLELVMRLHVCWGLNAGAQQKQQVPLMLNSLSSLKSILENYL